MESKDGQGFEACISYKWGGWGQTRQGESFKDLAELGAYLCVSPLGLCSCHQGIIHPLHELNSRRRVKSQSFMSTWYLLELPWAGWGNEVSAPCLPWVARLLWASSRSYSTLYLTLIPSGLVHTVSSTHPSYCLHLLFFPAFPNSAGSSRPNWVQCNAIQFNRH